VIRGQLLHPEILKALASAGHGSTVLISDGNFPHDTAPAPRATRVYLNLSPGRVTANEVLAALVSAIPIESVAFMSPQEPGDWEPPAHADLAALIPDGTDVQRIPRMAFYEATRTDTLALVIATADTRPYANVLLTIGVIMADA
jgi:L-fucose mutarotase